jgi:hypothetical protein
MIEDATSVGLIHATRVPACRLSVSLAITMTDLKLVDVLVKQLQPTGDLQAQVHTSPIHFIR